jgi:hypothetical protein
MYELKRIGIVNNFNLYDFAHLIKFLKSIDQFLVPIRMFQYYIVV